MKSFATWSTSKAALDQLGGVVDWTLHDLRRTFATRLAKMGTAPRVIERLLHHITGTISGRAAVDNRARYLEEMRAAVIYRKSPPSRPHHAATGTLPPQPR
jgi:integrase